jgi:hypothetical protein
VSKLNQQGVTGMMTFQYKSKAKLEIKSDSVVVAKSKDKTIATKNVDNAKIEVDDKKLSVDHKLKKP